MGKSSKLRNLISAILLLVAVSLSAQQAKYIFYFIGDGMGPGQVMMADTYKRKALGDSLPLTMILLPVHSLQTTYSASSPVTDSAAAGTALATGVKTKNSMLGMNADSIAVNSIARYLHDNGYGVALMTNSAADDATPGAFYAHVTNRRQHYEIGRQAAESGFELITGAALRGLEKMAVLQTSPTTSPLRAWSCLQIRKQLPHPTADASFSLRNHRFGTGTWAIMSTTMKGR